MQRFTQIVFIAYFAIAVGLSQKDDDESRPYEFGFTIDGQQHRHEKKDVRGIIEGEFGFITADGIYHVTVYATDENGKFKILSMRNLRISAPLDGSSFKGEISPEADKYRKQAGLAPLPKTPAPSPAAPNPLAIPQSVPEQQVVVSTPKNEAPFKFTTQPTIKPACASCGFVTTPKPIPGQPGNGFQFQNPIFQKQDQEKQHEQKPLSGPVSVSVPIPSSGPVDSTQQRFDTNEGPQPQGPQDTQSAGGPQEQSQFSEGILPPYQTGNAQQNAQQNYNSIGGGQGIQGAQYPNGPTQGVQYPSGADQGTQYPIGGTQGAQYPSNINQGVQYPSGGTLDTQFPSGGAQYSNEGTLGNQFSSGGTQYPSGGPLGTQISSEGAQRPSAGTLGSQFPIEGAQYPNGGTGETGGIGEVGGALSGGSGQSAQYPQYSSNDGGSTFGSAPFGGSGTIGSNGPNYQQGGVQPNPLQAPIQPPTTDVSNFPPVAISDGVIHVGGKNKQDIPIKDKYPGMQDGLPAGIEEKDISGLLYKFHYTIGFHGHYEKGYKNGAKVGGYFVNGRDGISRIVTYVADENGYRPKVKFINLGLSSEETPKPESEKTFGLKSFEFVWYPVE